ncbi:hypothetical protein DIE07_34580 [Burkholderia sp. Bp9002]|nr:hypothetical protein DIE07_34580 [Burkholderia sp. Bp9002]
MAVNSRFCCHAPTFQMSQSPKVGFVSLGCPKYCQYKLLSCTYCKALPAFQLGNCERGAAVLFEIE